MNLFTSVEKKVPAFLPFIFLAFTMLEGAYVLYLFIRVPSDSDVTRFLGYSAQRWAMIGAALLLAFATCAVILHVQRRIVKHGAERSTEPAGWIRAVRYASVPAGLLVLCLIFFLIEVDAPVVQRLYERLLPLGIQWVLAALQVHILLTILFPRLASPIPKGQVRTILIRAALLWIGLVLIGSLLYFSRFGMEKTHNGWYDYGIPFTHFQVLDIWLGALLVSAIITGLEGRVRIPPLVIDIGLCLVIWLAAVLVWMPMPVPNTWFSPVPMPPNNQVYPNSDALRYDSTAEGIVLGTEWSRSTAHYKPGFAALLAITHLIVGNDYLPTVRIQTLALAFLPVLLYLIGKTLHGRLAGGMLAALAILREYNQLLTGSLTTSSNTKLLMSELPTAFFLALLLLAMFAWLKFPQRRGWLAILAGGIIGFTSQMRVQVVTLIPVVLVLLAGYYFGQRKNVIPGNRVGKAGLKSAGRLFFGFLLGFAPLVIRNYVATGVWTVEHPGYTNFTFNYGFSLAVPGQYSLVDLAARNFVHNLFHTLLVLPSGFQNAGAWTGTKDLLQSFWITQYSQISAVHAGWVLFNLAFISLGVIATWKRSHWMAFLPAVLFGAYSLAGSASGFSGQRFMLPVDWVGYFYYAAGAAWLIGGLSLVLGKPALPSPQVDIFSAAVGIPRKVHIPAAEIAMSVAMLILGGLLPILEAVVPVHPTISSEEARAQLLQLSRAALSSAEMSILEDFLNRPGTIVMDGIVLYPREIYTEVAPGSFMRTDPQVGAPFLTYLHLGKQSAVVLQPWNGESSRLPHTARVIIAGWWVNSENGRFHAFITAQPASGDVYFSPNLQ